MAHHLLEFVRQHWRHIFLYGVGGMAAITVLVQLLYPHDKLLPNTYIDGLAVGSWQKSDAVWELDRRYVTKQVQVYFGSNPTPYRSPVMNEVGLAVKNQGRIERMAYPWWLQLVPTSLFWAHTFYDTAPPEYEMNRQELDSYITKELGQQCNVAPKNAGLKYQDKKLQVIKSEPGGSCNPAAIKTALQTIRPVLSKNATIRISMTEIGPAITTQMAETYVAEMMQRIGQGVPVNAGESIVVIPADQIISWMDFTTDGTTLVFTLSNDRAAKFLVQNIAPKVYIPAGVSNVTTMDFIETGHQEGVSGRALHIENTLASIAAFIRAEREDAVAATDVKEPRTEYTRSYSPTDTGLSALLANFAKDHTGTFGVSYIELSGMHRRAAFNENRVFVTASTYKLFVAFSTLKRVDSGTWSLTDENISNGRNLEKCLDDMIVQSDNACAEALLRKIGYRTITDEVRALGLKDTSFIAGDTPQSTASDEALFMAQLETGQLPLSPEGRSRFLDMLKRNIYRRGIPAGATGVIADKVGFLWSLLHDASIVYSPSGTYVLVVMTDGSSWGAIADLTRQLESLRSS